MLSEKSIQEIEKATGLKGLKEIIESTEAVDIVPKNTKHFTEETYNVLYDNLTKQGLTQEMYDEAKAAGEEMAVKSIKRSSGLEFEGKTVKALVEYYDKEIKLIKETDVTKATSELKSDIEKLRDQLTIEKKRNEDLTKQFESESINLEIDNRFNSIEIEVPEHIKDEKAIEKYIELEKQKAKLHFKTLYEFKKENGKILPMVNGQVLKDEVANPQTVDKLFKDYVSTSFIPVKKHGQNGGRGAGDSQTKYNLNDIKSMEDLNSFATKKGIKKGTEAFDALYQEYSKNIKNG